MENGTDLEARVRALEDLEAIKQLKYRYFRCLDLKLWDELRECFTPDATVNYGDGRYCFQGVDAILDFLIRSLGSESGALGAHHGHHPELELIGLASARGSWALDNYLFNPTQKRSVRIAAYYSDEYIKVDGRWRIQHTGYTALYHEEWNREDLPSLRLLTP
jgi:bile-acid 7alpha-dehydratase